MKPVSRVTVDLYVYIFLCDFINFFVLLFGFTAFGVGQKVICLWCNYKSVFFVSLLKAMEA